MAYKVLSVNLVGSRLYGLDGKNSDYDYVVVYTRGLSDYLTLGKYEDTMPDTKENAASGVVNYKYWDVMKLLRMTAQDSWAAFEYLMSTQHYDKPEYRYLLGELRPLEFAVKPLAFHCLGMMKSSHQRGYMKAYHFVALQYLLQHKATPSTLNAWALLNQVDLEESVRRQVWDVFLKKQDGVKDAPFVVEVDDAPLKALPNPERRDLDYVFHRMLGVG